MKKAWSGNLITQIMVAFAIAIIVGIIAGTSAETVKPLGDLFLRLIKFIIVPLVLASLVTGVSSTGDVRKLGRMGGKTIAYYLVTTALAVILGLIIASLMSPGAGLELKPEEAKVEAKETPGIIDTLLAIIPTNPFAALVQGDMLPIIFFAIFLGIGISLAGEKARTVQLFFEQFAEVMYKITGIVMRFAPIGVFGLVAPIVGKYGLSVLLPLSKVILGVAIGCLLHAAIVYSLSVKLFAGMKPLQFFKGIAPAGMIAFSTSSSSGTLPITIQNVESNLGVSKRVSSFVLPLGATINMDGTALYQGVCALFVAQFYGIDLSFAQLLTIVLTATLASIGTAGVPGAGLIMLTMVLTSVGLPLEGMALIAGVDRILDMFRTSVNVIGDASAAVVVASSEGELEQSVHV
ncbi:MULTISPECIES: dicarboxylate/amino acid:cation symporter [Brevibacillus]|jgi:Na+/H+-dicarboxylate symporter|uniref:Sodium:dicarboxylate symporter n=1 Tax=Brevibacillus borstelensis AK1 TaxID=1300222 RepID=M8E945_9BACL|nr:dicarboxylate/amino acid:cation symporter [Brevibacillus borstelensis]EMT51995.1 sodium:dicarboxylate symporter [Brevibacillus borstelensis AK1]KKX56409.1 sodium:dicarboxylate symporter [Brevibacillus borstelensis cifa_chp40]MBE5394166.1 dicarboxylate/amino acid:cation symporter [Brevibacillus borstelensis]MCC0565539.1 dicarboxylate/amino acid:cation symporter [Brevibacillus borstelensis]MCM3468882.1 dicarboxylate/amino acid:cation symporter [Brevibacillus borstelensis]